MTKSKKCCICGYEFTMDDKVAKEPLIQPFGDGAKYYYNLWHFEVEKCPKCGYSSKDISKTLYKKIINDEQYQSISKTDLLVELDSARPNRIGAYLESAYYYESVGEPLNNIKSLLQAGDLMYAELMYWDEYIFDSSDSVNALISKSQYNEIKKFADYLYNTAMDKLEAYTKENPEDIDALILLGGSLCDGNKIQNIKGAKILNNLKTMDLSINQKKALKFLIEGLS